MNITMVHRILPDIEEAHEVNVLSVQITKDLERWPNVLNYHGLCLQYCCTLIGQLYNMLPLARKITPRFQLLPLLRLHQRLQKHLTQRIIRILVNFNMIFVVRIQSFRLLCKFVD